MLAFRLTKICISSRPESSKGAKDKVKGSILKSGSGRLVENNEQIFDEFSENTLCSNNKYGRCEGRQN